MSLLGRAIQNVTAADLLPRRASGGYAPLGGMTQYDRTSELGSMGAIPTLFVIVDRLASGVAAVDWKLYRKDTDVEVLVHPALSVFSKPNSFYTQREFVEATMQHYDLTGEMWWMVGRAENLQVPLELWPIRPDRMRPIPGTQQFVDGYAYRVDGTDVPLGLEDVIFTKRLNPLDPYRGMSPIGSLMLDIEGEKAAAQYNAMFFRNGARPGGVVEIDEMLSDPEFEMLQRHWKDQHQGVHNSHRVAFLEKGHYKELTYTNKDMDFVQLRTFSKQQIMEAYGFPRAILGQVENVNRANAETAEVTFARWLLNPRLDLLRDALNGKFLPMFGSMGQGVEFRYDDPAPEDAEGERAERNSLVDNVVKLIAAGADPKATLAAFGLPDLPFNTGSATA